MGNNNDFYKEFSKTSSSKNSSFKSNFFVPFLCGMLGTFLVLGLTFGIPNIRNSILSTAKLETTNNIESEAIETSNSGVVDFVSLESYSNTAVYAANKVLPSIVGIKVDYTVTSNFSFQSMPQAASAEGSGIIISSDGYILTNNHIINSADSSVYYEVSEANSVSVYLFNDETAYEAKIIGTDKETDLAVIKIDKDNLTAAELGDSDSVKIGEFAMAIGNPLGMQSSVTSGIISAVNRKVTSSDGNTYTLIQTDAAINSGNSGGALINADGKVIGVNTLKLSGTGIEGMGFAIPINDTVDIYKELIKNGKILRPYIGIAGIDLDEKTAEYYNFPVGIYVKQIQSNSPASSSDLKTGDIITAADGNKITTMEELNSIKKQKNIGDKITLDVFRNNKTIQVEITLGEEP